jgi:primary-amine oxidase
MALDRLQSVTSHLTGNAAPPHPFDPLSNAEIEHAVSIVRKEHGDHVFNAVTMLEPRKKDMLKWIEDPVSNQRPARIADVVAIAKGGKVYDGLVDLKAGKVVKWETLEGVQPLVRSLWNIL